MEIIPAMYILDGRCVALYKGSFEQKETYYKSPVEMLHFFENGGAAKLHLVDLNSFKEERFTEQPIIKKIIESSKMEVQLEASFHTMEDIKNAFAFGAKKVVLRPFILNLVESSIKTFGADKIIVEIQAKGSGVVGDGKQSDGEPIDVVDFAEKLVPMGVKAIIYKDERAEGTMGHPNYDEPDRLFLITGKDLKIYASGGISEAKHLQLLKKSGVSGAIIGKALYEKALTVKEALAIVAGE